VTDLTHLRDLFADYASGEITGDELKILEAALREHADFRQEFIQYLNVDSALGDLASLSAAEIVELDTLQRRGRVPGSRGGSAQRDRIIALVGTIAAVLLIWAAVWMPSRVARPVARMVAAVDATLKTSRQEEWNKTELTAGAYMLERGLLHLQFAGGVMVYIEAPARFDTVNGKRMILFNGRLSASVPPAGIGFAVETPQAEVVDFGTEFSVDVTGGTSEVHVFEGRVRVQRRTWDDRGTEPIDLHTFQAVRIDKARPQPIRIEPAPDRFIRSFDEPHRKYPRAVKDLAPVAYYRMPIRDRGLVCEPPEFSGEVLMEEGVRPPHARGFIGGSLRVLAESTGRGGRVANPPRLTTGQFTLVALVYAEALAVGGTVATDRSDGGGCFALNLDRDGMLNAAVRTADGAWKSCTGKDPLPLKTWHHVVLTADGEVLRLYEQGEQVAEMACSLLQPVGSAPIWFGTASGNSGRWNGRIDEVAFFDRALEESQVVSLYQYARDQVSR